MADLAAHTIIKTRPRAGRDSFVIADTITLYVGALVGLEGGYLNHWADGANDVFMGVVLGGDDRGKDGILLGETSDVPPPEARVNTEGVVLMHLDSVAAQTTLSEANLGDLVYCGTSNTDDMTLVSSGRNHPIGWIVRFRSATDVDVQLFTPSEMLAQATA